MRSQSGISPATDAWQRDATLATPLRSRGFLSFLRGGARPIRTSSSCGYLSSNVPTLVDGRMGKSASGNHALRDSCKQNRELR
jgi:hypothetical protein